MLVLFPTLTCGVFVFSSVSASRRLPPPVPSLTLTHTHSLTHSHTHSLTHSLTHARTHARTHALTHSLTHARTHARTHSLTHSLSVFCVAGVGQCALPRGRMYALASLGLRLFCVAGVGQCALPRGRMYALASLGLRLFCVAGVGQCALPRGRMLPPKAGTHQVTMLPSAKIAANTRSVVWICWMFLSWSWTIALLPPWCSSPMWQSCYLQHTTMPMRPLLQFLWASVPQQ